MILLTGASGFLGPFIINELLGAGYELKVLVRNASERSFSWDSMVEKVEGDILDVESLEKAMEGVEQVIHAASVVSYWKRRHPEMKKINVEGTANVVNLCLDLGISRLIQISSIGALGMTKEGKWIDEKTPRNPTEVSSAYGQTKYDQELEVQRGIAEGLDAVILNPGVIIGPSSNWEANTAKIFSVVDKGLRFFNQGTTGLVGAEDVAKAVRWVMEHPYEPGERFVLVGENLSQKELLSQVAESINRTAPTWRIPTWLSILVGHISQAWGNVMGREPVITPETMKSSVKTHLYNGQKIVDRGFSYTPIREVIQKTGQAFLHAKP